MPGLFRKRRDFPRPASDLYAAIVGQARAVAFFRDLGVPDTVLGRFEMVALHAYLAFRRLRDAGPAGVELAQSTHDLMFADIDQALRELGIGDMGIGKRVKQLARNLYGRIAAYDRGLDEGRTALVAALVRNVYAGGEPANAEQAELLAGYLAREVAALYNQRDDDLLAGRIVFGSAPELPAPLREASA